MVGGGQMGTGIAQVAAIAGQQVFPNLKPEEILCLLELISSMCLNGRCYYMQVLSFLFFCFIQVVISDVSEAQLTASKNSLRGGLARFARNCPDL